MSLLAPTFLRGQILEAVCIVSGPLQFKSIDVCVLKSIWTQDVSQPAVAAGMGELQFLVEDPSKVFQGGVLPVRL